VYRDTPAEELAAELGIRTAAFTPATYGIHINNKTVIDSDNQRLIDRLPISSTARDQLRAFVQSSLDEYEMFTRAGQITDAAGELADLTVADRLSGLEPEAVSIITAAIKGGSVADPSELSAQYGLRYFASYLAHEQCNRLYPVDGMQGIPRAMADQLPAEAVRLRTRVDRIAFDRTDNCYTLTLADDPESVRAREVVVAVPAPITRQIVADLPQWKDEALATALMPGSTTLCVTADVTGLSHIARWAFIAVTGRTFDAIINPHPVAGDHAEEHPTTVQFVCYGNSAGYRPDLVTDPAATEAWIEDFLAVAPDLRGRVIGAHIQTWQHCFAILTPHGPKPCPSFRNRSAGCTSPETTHPRPPARTAPSAKLAALPTSLEAPPPAGGEPLAEPASLCVDDKFFERCRAADEDLVLSDFAWADPAGVRHVDSTGYHRGLACAAYPLSAR
jgi:Flavin containing amine oxidoreductase